MKLYGTVSSPYVRRVRMVAAEVGEPVDLVDVRADPGKTELRQVTPIGFVPVAIVEGRTIFDSRVIIEWLTTTRGWGTLAKPRDPWHTANLVNAVNAAQDSIVVLFDLRLEQIAFEGKPFGKLQVDRADAVFAWLATHLTADKTSFEGGFGLAEFALIAALDWMELRKQYPVERTAFGPLRAAWRDRPSVAPTHPSA